MGAARLFTARRLAIVVSVALLAACGSGSGTFRGVVIDVEGDLAEVTAFTILVEGEAVRLLPVEQGDYAFPLPHLREHQRSGAPIVVTWELVDGAYHALSVTDG